MKVAVVTGTRAEYGLLSPLMGKIQASPAMELQLLVTGSHLLPEFGLTINNIIADGFEISRSIPDLRSAKDGADVGRQVGAGIVAFTDALEELSPEVVVLLGDRFELLAAATAAFFLDIPILHIHGGEVTQGAFDDAIRHAISQFSRVHAVAAPEYAERLIRAGAQPRSVHVVGGLGIDALHQRTLLSRAELEDELGIAFTSPLLLVTYHPVTASLHDTEAEVQSLLAALANLPRATIVFTSPNADPENLVISKAVAEAAEGRENWHTFASLGSAKYFGLMGEADAVVGNSSSGLLEAPSLGVPTVNIGPRQRGRSLAPSVISCGTSSQEIAEALQQALSPQFGEIASRRHNPNGNFGASDRVMALLAATPFATLGAKTYYDAPHNE